VIRKRAIGGLGPVLVGGPQKVPTSSSVGSTKAESTVLNLAYAITPASTTDFIDFVVPELRKRGRAPSDYALACSAKNFWATRTVGAQKPSSGLLARVFCRARKHRRRQPRPAFEHRDPERRDDRRMSFLRRRHNGAVILSSLFRVVDHKHCGGKITARRRDRIGADRRARQAPRLAREDDLAASST